MNVVGLHKIGKKTLACVKQGFLRLMAVGRGASKRWYCRLVFFCERELGNRSVCVYVVLFVERVTDAWWLCDENRCGWRTVQNPVKLT